MAIWRARRGFQVAPLGGRLVFNVARIEVRNVDSPPRGGM
jgi:hypothetical protein